MNIQRFRKAPDGGEFLAMAGAVFLEDAKLVEYYFERYFEDLTPDMKGRVAYSLAMKCFEPVRI